MLDQFLQAAYETKQAHDLRNQLAEDLKVLPVQELQKIASGQLKLSSCGEGGEWLDQFEGTDHFEEAMDLERQSLQIEAQELQQRQSERRNETWDLRDAIRLKKRLLEYRLRSGPAPESAEEAPVEETPPEEAAKQASKDRQQNKLEEVGAGLGQLAGGLTGARKGLSAGRRVGGGLGAFVGLGFGMAAGAHLGEAAGGMLGRYGDLGVKKMRGMPKTSSALVHSMREQYLLEKEARPSFVDDYDDPADAELRGPAADVDAAFDAYSKSHEGKLKRTRQGAAAGALLGGGLGLVRRGPGTALLGAAAGALGGGALGSYAGRHKVGPTAAAEDSARVDQAVNALIAAEEARSSKKKEASLGAIARMGKGLMGVAKQGFKGKGGLAAGKSGLGGAATAGKSYMTAMAKKNPGAALGLTAAGAGAAGMGAGALMGGGAR